MGGKRAANGKPIIVPSESAAALDHYAPDLANWPQSWSYEETDVCVGERIVEYFKRFLLDLIDRNLAKKTIRRHRDRLWMLGGEIIKRRQMDPEFAAMSVDDALRDQVDEFGGPMLSGGISESEQEAFDATCRKLYSFISQRKNP